MTRKLIVQVVIDDEWFDRFDVAKSFVVAVSDDMKGARACFVRQDLTDIEASSTKIAAMVITE